MIPYALLEHGQKLCINRCLVQQGGILDAFQIVGILGGHLPHGNLCDGIIIVLASIRRRQLAPGRHDIRVGTGLA